MPRFFTHLRDGAELTRDPEGADLPSLEAARHEAVATGKQSLAEHFRGGGKLSEAMRRSLEITDESGMTVSIVTFSEAAEAPDHRA